MKKRTRNWNFHRKHLSVFALPVLFFIMFDTTQILAQDTTTADFSTSVTLTSNTTRTLLGGKITSNGYGGPAIKFSRFSNQFAFMTGGLGAFTINNRYTIGNCKIYF